jgi:hypothetical protein
MDRNGAQPVAEGPALLVVLEVRQFAHDHGHHLLRQVVGVGWRHGMVAKPALDERRVKLDKLPPRLRIRLQAQSIQQAEGGFRHEDPRKMPGRQSQPVPRVRL